VKKKKVILNFQLIVNVIHAGFGAEV